MPPVALPSGIGGVLSAGFSNILILAVVSFAISISVSKTFANRVCLVHLRRT